MIAYLAKGSPFHLLSTEQVKFTEKLLIILDYIDKYGDQLFVFGDSSSSLCKCSKHGVAAAIIATGVFCLLVLKTGALFYEIIPKIRQVEDSVQATNLRDN